MKCPATVEMEGFKTVCGAPDTVVICPFSNNPGCIANFNAAKLLDPEFVGTALTDAEEGEIVEIKLNRLGGGEPVEHTVIKGDNEVVLVLPNLPTNETLDYWRGYRHACRVLRESAEWSEKRADEVVKMLEGEQ